MEFETELRGEIVTVEVLSWHLGRQGNRRGHPDTWTPDEDWEADWVLIGEDGYELDWDLTREEEAQIESEVFFAMMCEVEDSKSHEHEKSIEWDD